jgi:protein phosphatase
MESLLRDLKGQLGGDDPVARYQQAVLRANRWVWEVAQTDVDLHGMGATLTTALIHRGRAYVAQVGDSRGYLLRGSTLYQMTEDQSLIGALVMMGELSARQAREAEGRNIMLQALGPQPDIQLAITELALQDGDLLILCTDGLFNQVPPNEISHVALASPSLRSCCEELIGRANDRGGPDNITIVTARVTGTGMREKSTEDDDHASFHRLKTFDPTEVLRRHPDLTEFATARARTARRRGRLLLGLIILFVLLLLIMASR